MQLLQDVFTPQDFSPQAHPGLDAGLKSVSSTRAVKSPSFPSSVRKTTTKKTPPTPKPEAGGAGVPGDVETTEVCSANNPSSFPTQ